MGSNEIWKKLCQTFRLAPADWEFVDGDATGGAYKHGVQILGLSFSPDDSVLALAGGGCIPGADGSIRLIDVSTRKNIRTLCGHVCGIHDVAFDPNTGILASASFDYAVHLWDLEKEDVIFLRGEDDKTKGFSKFTRNGSFLAIGEYDYSEGPHSFYIYDLKAQRHVFEFALPDELGVTAMALSPDSTLLAVSAGDKNRMKASRLFLVQLGSFELVQEHVFEDVGFYGLTFIGGNDRLLAGVDGGTFGQCKSGLLEIDPHSGTIHWSEFLGGIGVDLACHPTAAEVAVGFEGKSIRIYDSTDWTVLREHPFQDDSDTVSVCSMAYSNSGDLLAYGLSSGTLGIIESAQ